MSTQSLALRKAPMTITSLSGCCWTRNSPGIPAHHPGSFAYRFAVNRREFSEAIKRISLLSSERLQRRGAEALRRAGGGSFTIRRWGKARNRAGVHGGRRPGRLTLEVGFNARYFLETLQRHGERDGDPGLNEQDRPCRLVDQAEIPLLDVIMPMSL